MDFWSIDEFLHKTKGTILGCELIFHLGAITSTIEQDVDLLMKYNYEFSKMVYSYCQREKIRMIYASSASVYGKAIDGFSESSQKIPENAYAYSKLLFDQWIEKQNSLQQCVGLRFFNVYGPNEYHKGMMASVVLHFYNEIKNNGFVNIYKSNRPDIAHGEAKRDFIYVFDVVDVLLFFLHHGQYNGIYNLGTQQSSSYNQLANSIFQELDMEPHIQYIDMPQEIVDSYQYWTQADIKALRSIGYARKFYSLEQGIHDYITNYLKEGLYF